MSTQSTSPAVGAQPLCLLGGIQYLLCTGLLLSSPVHTPTVFTPRVRPLPWGSKGSPECCWGEELQACPASAEGHREEPAHPSHRRCELTASLFLSQRLRSQHRACCWLTMAKSRKQNHWRLRPGRVSIHWVSGSLLPPLP